MGLHVGHPSDPWASADDTITLRCNEVTGKVEAADPQALLSVGLPSQMREPLTSSLGSNGHIDSPLEPGLSKREVSFQTQMVRRAVSFIFNESAFENDPALEKARLATSSPPQTALAA